MAVLPAPHVPETVTGAEVPGTPNTKTLNGGEGNVAGVDFIDGPGGAIAVFSNSAQGGGEGIPQLVNGSDMDDDYVNASSQGNGRGHWHTFTASGASEYREIGADVLFDQAYNVTDIWIWNQNALNHGGGRGINTVDVMISRDGENLELLIDDFVVQRVPDPINQAGIPIGPHDYAGAGTNEMTINQTIRGIRLTDFTLFEDNDGCCFAFGELRFNIIPELATLGLLAAAGSLLLLKRRR